MLTFYWIDGLLTLEDKITARDGSTEFDTDLCILKKRGDILGLGIDNCDM
jgi:hypothetical protein